MCSGTFSCGTGSVNEKGRYGKKEIVFHRWDRWEMKARRMTFFLGATDDLPSP